MLTLVLLPLFVAAQAALLLTLLTVKAPE